MKKTELKIAKLYEDAAVKAQKELNNQVRAILLEMKIKHRHTSVEFISGMGTWVFKINDKSADEKLFIKLDEFLRLMAGTHNLYADSMKV